jgi:hypothetical protein
MNCWTSDTPTKKGFYYYRRPGMAPEHVLIAQVFPVRDASRGLFAEIITGILAYYQYAPVSELSGRWFGPLEQPPLDP